MSPILNVDRDVVIERVMMNQAGPVQMFAVKAAFVEKALPDIKEFALTPNNVQVSFYAANRELKYII